MRMCPLVWVWWTWAPKMSATASQGQGMLGLSWVVCECLGIEGFGGVAEIAYGSHAADRNGDGSTPGRSSTM